MATKNNAVDSAWTDPRSLGISDRTFFKAEDGKTRRIYLMADPIRAHVQFVPGLNFIHTFSTFENRNGTLVMTEEGLDMELLGKEPQLMWMVPVLVYDTDKSGQLSGKKVDYEFQLWSFYTNDYRRLYEIVTEWGVDEFKQKDLLITGVKKGRFINATISIAAKTAVCLRSGLKERVLSEFAAYQYRDAKRWIARTVTEEELREAVGKMEAQPQGSVRNATNS